MPVVQKSASMGSQKVKAYVRQLQENDGFWSALLVFLGSLFLLGAIPFYPVYLVPILALVCGALGYKKPEFGVLLGVLFAFPAIAYQSQIFGWVFGIIIAVVLFEMFTRWRTIAVIEILVMAPFSFGQHPLFGWITILGMVVAALHFGSKKSIAISIPSVFLILFLSSTWLLTNSAFMPLVMDNYSPAYAPLTLQKEAVGILALPSAVGQGLGNMFSPEVTNQIMNAWGRAVHNTVKIMFGDSGIIQIISWFVVLYLVSYLSGSLKGKHTQLLSGLPLLLMIPVYYGISVIFQIAFQPGLIVVIFLCIGVLGGTEAIGLKISRETVERRKEKMKSYGKFGFKDIGLSGDEKSMDDVGGYEDVKQELRDSIMMPLDKKEIAYAYGIKPPAGILLFGPPGTGKTMLMRALAKELRYNFISVKASDILSQWVGESLAYQEKIVLRRNGKIERIEIGEVVEEKINGEVLSFDQYGKTQFAEIKDHIKHKSTSKILEVKTKTGRTIKVTDYHSLFTLNGTKIEDIKTSELIPKKSYIAIPKKIPFSEKTIDKINFLEALRNEDHGLYVKNGSELLKKAIDKLGEKKVVKILGFRSVKYLRDVIKTNVGVIIEKFLKLMGVANILYDARKIHIGAGKNTLPGIIDIDENFATFLGLWVAEGSYNRKDTTRISTSKEECKKIAEICEKLFGKITIYEKKKSDGRDIYIGSRPLYVLLREVLGLESGAENKNVPTITYSFNKRNMAAFLRGYISGDGSIYQTNERKVSLIEANTLSKGLVDSTLHLLLYFGIVGKIYPKKEWTGKTSYRICFQGYNALNKFMQIGFLDNRRQEKLESYIKNVQWHRSEQIPIVGRFKDIIQTHAPRWSNSNTIGMDKLNEINWGTEEPEFIEQIENDIYLDRVEEIREVENEKYVYDISVKPGQNFVAGFGGIFAHNSEKNVAEIFDNARKNAPTILFFDEIDSLGKKRGSHSSDDVAPRVLSIFLTEMDGAVKTKNPVLVVGATNVPDQLDPALLRPGRFDKIIYMHLPDKKARKKIFNVHLGKLPYSEDVDFNRLAMKTQRFSGADIKNIVNEAIKLAAKEATRTNAIVPVNMAHFTRVLQFLKPSTSLAKIDDYERFKLDFARMVGAEDAEKPKEKIVKWEDVAGLKSVKKALLEAIEVPLLHEDLMKQYKVKPSKGILLFGPPGTGKTLIARAASSELQASFQPLSGAEIMRKGITEATGVIRETFNRARENTPAIIFVDEIETFAPARGSVSSDILGQFLTEMDGVKGLKGVVVVAATNKPSLLDPAILRPGRFDKIFYVPPPDARVRRQLFKIHLGDFAEGIDLQMLAQQSPGFTGADIASIAQEAKMKALRAKIKGKTMNVTTTMILSVMKKRRPSLTQDMLNECKMFLEHYGERGIDDDDDDSPPPKKKPKSKDTHYV